MIIKTLQKYKVTHDLPEEGLALAKNKLPQEHVGGI